MTGVSVLFLGVIALTSNIGEALSRGETAETLGQFAENTIFVIGSGGLLGLGIGVVIGGIAMYKYQEMQINSNNRTSKL